MDPPKHNRKIGADFSDNASTSSDSTMAATDSSRNNYQSTCHLEERCCKLTADSPYTFNKNFEDKEDLFEEILYILKGKTVTEEQGQLLEKKYTSDFRDMVPLLKQYHEAIQYSKKTYDECWKIGRMKEESKFQLKTIPNKYLLLCLYSGAFCGADRAALKQICKDLDLDFSVKQAVIRWGLQRYYPKIAGEHGKVKLLHGKRGSNTSILKSILFVARTFHAMEALGQYKLIPGSRLRYLVENVLFVIEERAELDIKKETKATISTKRKRTSKSESARKKPKTNKSSIEREVQATKQEYTKSIPGKEKPTKYDKSHPLYHPPMHPVQHFQDEETDNFDTEDTAVVDDRKLTANQSLLPNINETGELERPTPNHEVARTSKSSTSKKKRKQSIPVRRPSIPDQQLLEVLPSVAPISPSRKDDNPVFAHLDRLEARFEQGRRMLEQGRQLFEQGMQIYDASLDEIRDLRETIQKDEEEREAKLDVINKLMRQL